MKTKIVLVGGFLGAGKTMLLRAADRKLSEMGKHVGLITNDQASELVDTVFLQRTNTTVSEVSGSCFCCNFPGFIDAIANIRERKDVDAIVAEPVGSCTDLSATILQPLKDEFAGKLSVAPLSVLVDPERQEIRVDGKKVLPAGQLCYYLVYKPKGYVSTASDPQGRPKVTDLVALPGVRLYPVGRLDLQTSGLLILTNDGELTFLLTHPRHEVWKTYQAQVTGAPSAAAIARLRQGVLLPEGQTAPARVKMLRALPGGALLEISLREGKKRQVRKMCEAVGHPVIELRRTSLAFLTLDGLRPGQHRQLTPDEVRTLKELAAGGETTTVVSERVGTKQSIPARSKN